MTEANEEARDWPSHDGENGRPHPGPAEDRVRKLEEAIAELASKVATDAVADRVLARLATSAPPEGAFFDSAGPLPSRALALIPPAAPQGAVFQPPGGDPGTYRWLLFRLWEEVRLAVRMYFDPRYRISRTAQFQVPALIGLMFANYFLFSVWFSLPIVSPIVERFFCVILAVLCYRVVTRELARYREVLDYLARYPGR